MKTEVTFALEHKLQALSFSQQDYLLHIRRHLHKYPELSWKEEETVSFIKGELETLLKNYKVSYSLKEKTGGLILDITFSPSFDRILFRADIDALPIQEETNLPYSSLIPNRMHACGHDCHVAMLLGMIKLLTSKSITCAHNLRFVFQRAEEFIFKKSGGFTLVKEGVLSGISKVYGLHISSTRESGVFFSKPDAMMANSSSISFSVKCLGGHVMNPQNGSNAIDVLTDIHVHLRGFIARQLGGKETISFIPSISIAGNTVNIMPEYGYATYAFRNYLPDDKKSAFFKALEKRLHQIVKTYPNTTLHSFEVCSGYPPLINNVESYEYVDHLLKAEAFETRLTELAFCGEDFSYYLKQLPGSYWLLGAKQGEGYDHHTSLFNPSESVLWMGTAFWLMLATSP